MKFQKIEVLADGEIQKHLAGMSEEHGNETAAAKVLGITQPEYSRARRSLSMPPRKLLDTLDLEVRRVIVRKDKSQGK